MKKLYNTRKISVLMIFVLLAYCIAACGNNTPQRTPEVPRRAPEAVEFKPLDRVVKSNVYLNGQNIGGMKELEVLDLVGKHAARIEEQPKNAELKALTWEIKLGKMGKKVNVAKTMDAIMNAAEGRKIKLTLEEVSPLITSRKLKSRIVRIGSYSTPLIDDGSNRVNNIQLAAEKIDYKILAPGEEFSFNQTVGRRSPGKGYEKAPIIIRTKDGPKKRPGTGGGVCQLSTTIFNAAEGADLQVTERHEHSKDVGYVPEGKDATVAYGSMDFKFVNSRSHPVMIRVFMSQGFLTVELLENRN